MGLSRVEKVVLSVFVISFLHAINKFVECHKCINLYIYIYIIRLSFQLYFCIFGMNKINGYQVLCLTKLTPQIKEHDKMCLLRACHTSSLYKRVP